MTHHLSKDMCPHGAHSVCCIETFPETEANRLHGSPHAVFLLPAGTVCHYGETPSEMQPNRNIGVALHQLRTAHDITRPELTAKAGIA